MEEEIRFTLRETVKWQHCNRGTNLTQEKCFQTNHLFNQPLSHQLDRLVTNQQIQAEINQLQQRSPNQT